MLRKLFFTAACLAGLAATLPAQTPDLVLNPGSNYVDVGRGIPWGTSFNRSYVLVPNSPNASVCIYVVNNNPTNAHPFTTSTFQAADSQVADYSHNQGRYNTVPILNMATSVPAGSMVSGFIQSTAAAKVAISFSGSSALGGSPDTADVFLVQTTSGTCGSASSALPVQGPNASGTPATANPLLIGTKDSFTGNAVLAESLAPGETGSSRGLSVGGSNTSYGTTYLATAVRLPAGTSDGPLAVNPVLPIGSNGGGSSSQAHSLSMSRTPCGGGVSCSQDALLTSDAGAWFRSGSVVFTTTGQTQQLWNLQDIGHTLNAEFQTCHFDLYVTAVSGTTPTLDLYIQDSGDNSSWDDRVHFTQVTAPAKIAVGIAGGSANETMHAIQNRALAVGTVQSGPLDAFGQLVVVVGGTSPNFTLEVIGNCK